MNTQCFAHIKIITVNFGNSLKNEDGTPTKTNVEIASELLDKVASILPKQPWPGSVHKIVAEKLGISSGQAYKCITKLIILGRCNPQINGVVYVKKEMQEHE